jgi:4-hydroxy-2-oxoheptanedioate aldolase
MHESVAAIASCGASPIVRIPANEGWMVKRALDSGAHGIVVPLLRTADDARTLVQSAKFPPVGRRGYGSPFTMGSFAIQGDLSGLEYLQNANESLLTIVQIETKEAFEGLDDIAKVEGIDVLFIGPWDLGNNLGYPVTGDFAPELKAAIAKILDVAKANGKKAGIYTTSGEMAKMYADQGFDMVWLSLFNPSWRFSLTSHASDLSLSGHGCAADFHVAVLNFGKGGKGWI